MNEKKEVATCRGCGRPLIGKPYYTGDRALIPETKEYAPVNQYGGFVCCEICDINACIELERTMPGCNTLRSYASLSSFAKDKIKENWSK